NDAQISLVSLATISLNLSTVADSDGKYLFDHVPLGPDNSPLTVAVSANKNGYFVVTRKPLSVSCGQITTVDLQEESVQFGTVSGVVTIGIPDPNDTSPNRAVTSSGTPIANALLSFSGFETRSGSDGAYTISLALGAGGSSKIYTPTVRAGNFWTANGANINA